MALPDNDVLIKILLGIFEYYNRVMNENLKEAHFQIHKLIVHVCLI